jgi:small basic protein
MIKIIIGLVSVMIANVLLGVTLAKLKQEFKKEKLLSGLVKYLGIVLGVLLMYLTGYLNPDIVVANINNVEVNLMTGIEVLFISGIIYYGMQDLIKLKNLLGLSNDITPTDEGRG